MIDWDLIDDDILAVTIDEYGLLDGLICNNGKICENSSMEYFCGDKKIVALRPDSAIMALNSYQGTIDFYIKAYELERKERKALAIKLNKKESND